tara:strand:- start:198 stop:833 length:636 start_codon:yes stop_codon:yes gene_type:complete
MIMRKERLAIKRLLQEEAKSRSQQKLMGMALNCKRTGDCPSPEIKKMADGMSEKELKDFAGTKHDGLPDKVEPDTKNEIRNIVKEEILALLGETFSTNLGLNTGKASYGVESPTPRGWDRDPVPVPRPRGYDKPYDRNPNLNYDKRIAPWKLDLLKTAMVEARKCGVSEKEVAKSQNMLKSILEEYDDSDMQAASEGSKLVGMVLNAVCGI